MNKKIFLTSVIAMGFVAPAMAEPSNTDTFPQDGLMLEDYTYTNAATSTNMAGVYEGTVDAVAQYTDNLYQLVAGQYLPGNSETPIDCDQNGYFCPGDNNGVYYSSSAQGLNQCPSGYANTANGASANTDCYRTCTNNDVAHSTGTVNGGYYYGDNNQCSPTACENGWHIKPGLNVANTIGNKDAINSANISNSGSFTNMDFSGESHDAAYYGLSTSNHNSFAVNYGSAGMIYGHGRCSTTPGTFDYDAGTDQLNAPITTFSSLTDETGQEGAQYCYCNVDGYTPAGGTMQSVSSAWVFRQKYSNASGCADYCANGCAGDLHISMMVVLPFRDALFGSVAPGLASCEANTITINWDGASATEINANNAGTATYGSDIRTPRSATPVPGKTFTGWRFVAPQQASVQEP